MVGSRRCSLLHQRLGIFSKLALTQLQIIDDFLTEDQILDIRRNSFLSENLELDSTGTYSWDEVKIFHPIINFTSKYFDLSNCVLYEIWQQNNTRPDGWHKDKDEVLWREGILKYPLCTSVYYLDVNVTSGGNLFLEDDIVIEPKTNRLVLFGPDVEHFVQAYSGIRHSIIINPWDRFLAS